MNDEETQKGKGAEEMNGARRLAAAEQTGSIGKAASMVGDMVRPVSTISGPSTKITRQ